MYYDDLDYAKQRLTESLVMANDEPFFITHVERGEEDEIVCGGYSTSLARRTPKIVPLKEIDLTPVPLGFVNCEEGLVYLCRFPNRGFKQGAASSNVKYVYPTQEFVGPGLNNYYVGLTVKGRFSKLEEVIEKKQTKAVSRNFAISNNSLFYKGELVGEINDPMKVNWFKKNHYLQDYFEEEVNGQICS